MKIGIFALNSDVWKMHQKLLCRWGYKKLRYYTMFLKNFVYSKLTFAQISRKKIAVLYWEAPFFHLMVNRKGQPENEHTSDNYVGHVDHWLNVLRWKTSIIRFYLFPSNVEKNHKRYRDFMSSTNIAQSAFLKEKKLRLKTVRSRVFQRSFWIKISVLRPFTCRKIVVSRKWFENGILIEMTTPGL